MDELTKDLPRTVRFHAVGVNMPQMWGLDCANAACDVGLHPLMKGMMATTEADNTFIYRTLECGADEFLMKPFKPGSLRDKLMILGLAA